ncbi:hypothetical protein MLD38_003848 [Melastoma candidum]|uniref:Uncharacterized protein n=1 Tax=Melastoma candidum TaxID=119954 RepID=A0ACB9S3J4_9MYRT|nr:hypothetical protein MLD38_003848 [Melastoma candidum]
MTIYPILDRGTSRSHNYAGKKAVCYLNSYGIDFEGGLFHFRDGEPGTVAPSAGDVLIYTADSCNVHSVDEITMEKELH